MLLFAGLVDGLDGLGRLVVLHRAFACCSALLPGLGRFFYFIFFKNIFYRNIFLVSQFTVLYPYRSAGPLSGGRDLYVIKV